jgi:hypothetical protein
MNRIHHLPAAGRSLRFSGPVENLLEDISNGDRLYIYQRNRLCELAIITSLGNPVYDRSQGHLLFPENALVLSLPAVDFVHGVTVQQGGTLAYVLEFAMKGEPRAICIAAIPDVSNVERFGIVMARHPSTILTAKEFEQWQKSAAVPHPVCPCCEHEAKRRREHPEDHPLTAIFNHALTNRVPLHCNLESPHRTFSTWILPRDLHHRSGILGIVSDDEHALLEIDLGLIHSMDIRQQKVDGQQFAVLKLYDSVGTLHFTICSLEPEMEGIWRGFCQRNWFSGGSSK